MHLRYSFRIEPSAGQRIALARTFGCARVVYNDALAARKDVAGRYFASFVVDIEPEAPAPVDSEVGIDLGLSTYAVLSNAQTIDNRALTPDVGHTRHWILRI